MKKLDVSSAELAIKSRAVKIIGELRGAKPDEILCVARVEQQASDDTKRFEYKIVLKNGKVL
tara:strand:+ start:82 stop:267 length:186 start_codon:yes stop_codon:yes gene_type:complete